MKSFFKLLACSCLLLLVFGCKSTEDGVAEAREAVINGTAECALVKNNKIIATYSGNGVNPLLELYKQNTNAMDGGVVIDKVIGRAAAFIVINGKASGVYALLISEDAKELLEEYSIQVEYDKIVPRILDSQLINLCPLEESVLDENDPIVALEKLQVKIELLQKNASMSSNTQDVRYLDDEVGAAVNATRDLGSLDFVATKFGLGQNTVSRGGIDSVALIIKGYNLGVNYFDTSNAAGPNQLYYGEAFRKLGLVPGLENYDEKKRRDIFFVSKTRSFSNASDCVADIKRTLTQVFGDDKGNYPADAYIDMMMLHDIATIEEVDAVYAGLEDINNGIKPQEIGALVVLKDFRDGTNLTGFNPENEKVIKHIGLAAHYSPAPVMELLQRDELNLIEGLLVTINPNDNVYFSMQNNVIPVAKAKNMGVIGMKVFAWGSLVTPELTSHSLIEYALTTPGVDIIITGIAEISENQQECQLYQNLLAANNAAEVLTDRQREKIEVLAKTVAGGNTNFFQAGAIELTGPRNMQLKSLSGDTIISWDNAYAGESQISHYNIIRDGKNIAQIEYKPQTTLEQYSYIDKSAEESAEYQISVTDQIGDTLISEAIY